MLALLIFALFLLWLFEKPLFLIIQRCFQLNRKLLGPKELGLLFLASRTSVRDSHPAEDPRDRHSVLGLRVAQNFILQDRL